MCLSTVAPEVAPDVVPDTASAASAVILLIGSVHLDMSTRKQGEKASCKCRVDKIVS